MNTQNNINVGKIRDMFYDNREETYSTHTNWDLSTNFTDSPRTVHTHFLSIKVDNINDGIIWKQARGTSLCFETQNMK